MRVGESRDLIFDKLPLIKLSFVKIKEDRASESKIESGTIFVSNPIARPYHSSGEIISRWGAEVRTDDLKIDT